MDCERRDGKQPRLAANWPIYAAAAGAALSAATNVDAGIISGSPDVIVTINSNANGTFQGLRAFDIPGVGFDGLGLSNFPVSGGSPRFGRVGFERGSRASRFDFFAGSSKSGGGEHFARKYALGATIRAGSGQTNEIFNTVKGGVVHGKFGVSSTGFVGFGTISDGIVGWLQIEIKDRNSDGYPDEVELLSYAYNNAGGQIIAGELTATQTAPEPGTASLGLLAAGAAGILALRRRRKEAGL